MNRAIACVLLVLTTSCATAQAGQKWPFDAAMHRKAVDLCMDRGYDVPFRFFTTDGCSFWPDGDYVECCIVHDMAYWCGGSFWERMAADAEMAACVEGLNATAMYAGVRAFGWCWVPAPWRWGYGRDWPWARGDRQ